MNKQISNRLNDWLDKNSLTATQLANILSVQKSSISHILSGRNKPSFDFLYKFKEKFPELNLNWFIYGENNEKKAAVLKENIENMNDKSEINNNSNLDNSENKINEDIVSKPESVLMIYSDDTYRLLKQRTNQI